MRRPTNVFIVVNTKTGNLSEESSFCVSEGLMVMDLQDQGK
jgi:hypothetical protein